MTRGQYTPSTQFKQEFHIDREEEFDVFLDLLDPSVNSARASIFWVHHDEVKKIGKSWLAQRFHHYCSVESSTVPVVYITFEKERENDATQTYTDIILAIRRQLQTLHDFNELDQTIHVLESRMAYQPLAMKLRQYIPNPQMVASFAPYFDLPPAQIVNVSLPLYNQIDELVWHAVRHGQVSILLDEAFRGVMTNLVDKDAVVKNLWDGIEHLRDPAAGNGGEVIEDVGRFMTDHGVAPVQIEALGEQERQQAFKSLTNALFKALEEASIAHETPIVLLVDGFHALPAVVRATVEDVFLPALFDIREGRVLLVVTSRLTIDRGSVHEHVVYESVGHLRRFSKDEVRTYMENRGIPAEKIDIDDLYPRTDDGLPGKVAEMAELVLSAMRKRKRQEERQQT